MTLDDPVTLAERYALVGARMTPPGKGEEKRTDLDILIAAGIAGATKPSRMAALRVRRMVESGDRRDIGAVVEFYDGELAGYLSRKGRRQMPKDGRRYLIAAVLTWMMHQRCDWCGGTGVIPREGTAGKLTDTCDTCHGSTIKPLSRAVPHTHARTALWLVDEINQQAREALKHMNVLLANKPLP